MPDLRLNSDRYLDLETERAKAERVARQEATTDVIGLSRVYYAMTDDVDEHRRARFLSHIARAELRGESLVNLLPGEGRILEVGCGTGGLLVAAARSGRSIVGTDIATRWLVVARRRLTDRGVHVPLFGVEAERLPWPDGTFDCVVADSVLEHLDDPSRALREWSRVVRPGGRLLVWSPNRLSIGTDPHVGLWGLGFLPRIWIPSYVQMRRKIPWMVRPLSAGDAAILAAESGWSRVKVAAAAVSEDWSGSEWERRLVRFYERVRRSGLGGRLVRAFGPLWQLEAMKPMPGEANGFRREVA